MTIKPKIAYLTTMWGRHELTAFVFAQVKDLAQNLSSTLELLPIAAGSEDESSRQLAENHGFIYVEVPNSPLGFKWNSTLAVARKLNVDGVCIFGSDDLANKTYFLKLAGLIHSGSQLVGMRGLYFLDVIHGRILFWKGYAGLEAGKSAGAGRFISTAILEKLDWRLWPDAIERGLDKAMSARLMEHKFTHWTLLPCENKGAVVMDIKGYGGMNSFETIASAGDTMLLGNPYSFLVQNFSRELASNLSHASRGWKDCSDVWLNREPEPASNPLRRILCMQSNGYPEATISAAPDFINTACNAGYETITLSLQEFFETRNISCDLPCYGAANLQTLTAFMETSGEKLLDYRTLNSTDLKENAGQLPFYLIGAPHSHANSLPAPYSASPGYPAFEQRAHIAVCIKEDIIANELARHYMAARKLGLLDKEFLFCADWQKALNLEKENILFISSGAIYFVRALFKAVIFTSQTLTSQAAYFLAAGTPGVCINPEGELPESITPAANPQEAMAISAMLIRKKAIWENASRKTREFAQEKNLEFVDALNKLLL